MVQINQEEASLILAAEDCSPEDFDALHRFSRHDERIIRKLVAHGPVLVRGGRGSGKSALMIEAARRLWPTKTDGPAFGVYLSLRHLPLLRSTGADYEKLFCRIVSDCVRAGLPRGHDDFSPEPTVNSVQEGLSRLAGELGRRVVLLFDDAAHIGREASLAEFFDLFRTLSSSAVSCKATIYPGVTRFGTRFDVYNDATTVDVSRSEEQSDFEKLYRDILEARYRDLCGKIAFSGDLDLDKVAGFLAGSVIGNMRAFVFACNELTEEVEKGAIGVTSLGSIMIRLAANYYWPLLEELQPKLGVYEPVLEPAKKTAELLFEKCSKDGRRSVLIHRDLVAALGKTLELLEYAGFLSRREVSRAMKSRGRGSRYALNLCNLLESTTGSRLTTDLFGRWYTGASEILEMHRGSELAHIDVSMPKEEAELGILQMPISTLEKSNAYPYGLTQKKIEVLQRAGYDSIGDLARADDEALLKLWSVGDVMLKRIKNVVGQAIWM